MQLSDHFALEELTFSSTAVRQGIDNQAPPEVVTHLTILAQTMEKVRTLLGGKPIHVDSGYRCPELNKAVGGVSNSAHLAGYAIDFICPDYGTPLDIVHAIDGSDIDFDQCIQEGTWVHLSVDPAMRRETLTAHFIPGGQTTYTKGA
jgi:hypothetical protein